MPEVTESVSMSKDGTVNITLNNLTLDSDKEIDINFDELNAKDIEAFIVTGAMDAHNTFDNAEIVTTKEFRGFEADGRNIRVNLPARSVVLIRAK